MKKVLCLMLVAMTVLALAIPMGALAERHSFRIYGVYCTSENDPPRYYPTQIWKYNSLARMYVIHEALGTSNAYTNLLHATRSTTTGANGILAGQKWCTPDLYVPIQSNAIYQNYYYGVAARGNTKYNIYEGLTQFDISGGFDPN